MIFWLPVVCMTVALTLALMSLLAFRHHLEKPHPLPSDPRSHNLESRVAHSIAESARQREALDRKLRETEARRHE